MDFNFELMADSFPLLLAGAGITVEITAISVTFGLLIGSMIGIARLCTIKPLRYLANVYVDFIRGTPLLVQIFLVRMLPRLFAQASNPLIKVKWKPVVAWVCPGHKLCVILLCRKHLNASFLLWATNLSQC